MLIVHRLLRTISLPAKNLQETPGGTPFLGNECHHTVPQLWIANDTLTMLLFKLDYTDIVFTIFTRRAFIAEIRSESRISFGTLEWRRDALRHADGQRHKLLASPSPRKYQKSSDSMYVFPINSQHYV